MIDEDVHQRVKPLKLRTILEQYANGKGPAKASKKAAATAAAKPAKKKPAAKKVTGRPGSAGKRTVARKPALRGKPVRAAAKRGARR
jgi:hypothetical protein